MQVAHTCSWCKNRCSMKIHAWCKEQMEIFKKTELIKKQNPRVFMGLGNKRNKEGRNQYTKSANSF